jgi:hypothetical protein
MPHKKGRNAPFRLTLQTTMTTEPTIVPPAVVPPPQCQTLTGIANSPYPRYNYLPQGSNRWIKLAQKRTTLHRQAIRAAQQPEEGLVPTAEELQELHAELSVLWSGNGQDNSG